ncbi:MAG TPA: methyltransferase domain-containing protein [Egibacteraceae bacterium]|nr:methyltransferase domain-containing protein [Egibacteraceae bacterium]
MHGQVIDFVSSCPREFATVVEIGSRDINGTVRGLFTAESYTGIDLYEGPGVDVVGDCLDWSPPEPVDAVVCCEVLEHAPDAEGIVRRAHEWLRPGGTLILTCATDPRSAHSGISEQPWKPGEFYRNVKPDDMRSWLDGFDVRRLEVGPPGDLRVLAVKE